MMCLFSRSQICIWVAVLGVAVCGSVRGSATVQPADHEFTLRSLGATNGLTAKVVPDLLVDRHGFLWVGSRNGLFRYDGYRAVRYLPGAEDPTSISDLDIRSLYEDGNGDLWIGTNTGGLNRFDAAAGGFERFRHDSTDPASLSYDSVYGISDGPRGNLWVATQIGLNRLDRSSGRFHRYLHDPDDPSSLSNDYVFTLLLDRSGDLWIATVGGGINRWNPDTESFDRFDLATLSGGPATLNDVFGLAEAADGTLWIGTRTGIVRADRERRRFDWLDMSTGEEPLVTTVEIGPDDGVWMTTIGQGLLRFDPADGSVGRHGNEVIPEGMALMSLTQSEGRMLVGTWGNGVLFGRQALIRHRWLAEGGPGGLADELVTAVTATSEDGKPWVGTFGAGPHRVDVEQSWAERLEGEIAAEGVQSMVGAGDSGLWVGTTHGLWKLDANGEVERSFEHRAEDPAGIGLGYVTALLGRSNGHLWVGVGGSGLFRLNPGSGRFTSFRHDPSDPSSLSGNYITALYEESATLWVGTRSNGLNRCRLPELTCSQLSNGEPTVQSLGDHHITALYRDSANRLWVATNSTGLYLLERDSAGRRTVAGRWGNREGLVSDSVMAITEDDDGALWISTREGLTRLEPESGRIGSFTPETGLPVGHFDADAAAGDGSFLYFGAIGGLLIIPRGQAIPPLQPAPVRITAIDSPALREDSPAPPWSLSEHTLAFGEPLSIEFAVLDFSETIHAYEYRLSADAEWQSLGPRREVTFFGLAPGSYRFEVRGRDVQGLWATATPLELTIVPPFWHTTWFRLLSIAVIASAIFGAHTWRLSALERRNRQLSRLKDQRERALRLAQASEAELKSASEGLSRLARRLETAKEEERQNLSRELHDELGQSLTAAKIRLQLIQQSAVERALGSELEPTIVELEKMIRQVQSISLGLRPPLLDEAGLVPALRFYMDRLSEASGLPIEVDLDARLPSLPPELETVLFRVIQEAVSNSLRHADSQRIEIKLEASGNSVTAVIADDGRGFEPGEIEHRILRGEHLGLLGMRERLRSVGGKVRLDSSPDQGTRLEARIDL